MEHVVACALGVAFWAMLVHLHRRFEHAWELRRFEAEYSDAIEAWREAGASAGYPRFYRFMRRAVRLWGDHPTVGPRLTEISDNMRVGIRVWAAEHGWDLCPNDWTLVPRKENEDVHTG